MGKIISQPKELQTKGSCCSVDLRGGRSGRSRRSAKVLKTESEIIKMSTRSNEKVVYVQGLS